MRHLLIYAASIFMSASANAASFTFGIDPFAGSTALTTAGRQVVGGEPFITFNVATDQFVLASSAFGPYGFGPNINFANDVIGNIPTSGNNMIVLRTFDDDANAATVFGAGNAANLIATRLTSPAPGFFIYFNSALDLPRLVFSTDLNDNTSDLKIIARLTNLPGQAGRDAMATFTAGNFVVPEPSSWALLLSLPVAIWSLRLRRRAGLLAN